MGTLTINVEDKVEKKFREIATTVYGKKKGTLGKAVTEAMKIWTEEESKNNEVKAVDMLRKGLNLGGIKYKKREDLHERRYAH